MSLDRERIEDLLQSLYNAGWNDCLDGEYKGKSEEEILAQTSAQLETIVREARIEELGHIQLEYGGRFIATTYADGSGQTITARIEDLKEQLNKSKEGSAE